ncbi:MAG: NAD(P)-dependent oxidoreductase [Solirubrobacterales bacterium]|nr:NAD(P)-dependent oxidoreductase [Solirubrobacterales bacterium]
MAANLLRAGYSFRAWDSTPARSAALAAQGATSVSRPGEVAEARALVISSLSNDRVLEEVVGSYQELLRLLGSGGIHISTSTVAPETSRQLAEDHTRHAVSYLAAPVLGRPDAAAATKLWIFVSGPAEAKQRRLPILQVLGQGVFDLGDDSRAANVVKVAQGRPARPVHDAHGPGQRGPARLPQGVARHLAMPDTRTVDRQSPRITEPRGGAAPGLPARIGSHARLAYGRTVDRPF